MAKPYKTQVHLGTYGWEDKDLELIGLMMRQKIVVLQVSIYMYPVRLERRLLCDIGVRWTPSNSEILSVPKETFYFYN